MTRKSNYVLLSCVLLQKQDEVLSAKGNHTIAVVNGGEKYETLKVSFIHAARLSAGLPSSSKNMIKDISSRKNWRR